MSFENCKKILADALEHIKKEHVVDLMKARRTEELEVIKEEINLSEVGEYAVSEKCLEFQLSDFEYEDPLELIFLLACFADEYQNEEFEDDYVFSNAAIEELVEELRDMELEFYANIATYVENYLLADCDLYELINCEQEDFDDDDDDIDSEEGDDFEEETDDCDCGCCCCGKGKEESCNCGGECKCGHSKE